MCDTAVRYVHHGIWCVSLVDLELPVGLIPIANRLFSVKTTSTHRLVFITLCVCVCVCVCVVSEEWYLVHRAT